ncbi:DnaA/Hda family protein, partial [Klebsiella pneumoniae]|nr:DnaA/Hda family protein [Klebsiella pneumoniae]
RAVSVETLPEAAGVALTLPVVAEPQVDAKPAAARPALDPRFTFARFVVGESNRVAFNAARALAEPGQPRFSPLFLHSNTGQG